MIPRTTRRRDIAPCRSAKPARQRRMRGKGYANPFSRQAMVPRKNGRAGRRNVPAGDR
ncbi:hypothetical protein MCA2398 [Methylococcus capsulatus str. Bath]|uniref:Uncharacterized protein n=1 Tax=Methylococcus capsulatus (strain ATCC 33009 / NCIMB 11132 / Bath) TaxID=243233 RepID=Q604Y7_METCA|nr:hypothetical protein MCA2398 [Methylococcus capsulatus str. Bath]